MSGVALPKATILAPDGSVAVLASHVATTAEIRMIYEYFAMLQREQLVPKWRCWDCHSNDEWGEIDLQMNEQVFEFLFRCKCRTIYGKAHINHT